jgi:hypothetical protein
MKTSASGHLIARRSLLLSAGMAAGVAAAATGGKSAADLKEVASAVTATNQAATARFRRVLRAAAQKEGIRLNLEQLVFASKYNYLFIGAPALGMELIDPIELRGGITQGLVYVDAAIARGLRGFYVVRAVANQDVRLGAQPVRVQMVQRGIVMAEEPGIAQVRSLKVPPGSAGLQTQLGVGFDLLGSGEIVRSNCWTCPNGVTICAEKPICGVDGLLPSGSSGCP